MKKLFACFIVILMFTAPVFAGAKKFKAEDAQDLEKFSKKQTIDSNQEDILKNQHSVNAFAT